MTYTASNIVIHKIDEEPVCGKTLRRWFKSIPSTPPSYSWASVWRIA